MRTNIDIDDKLLEEAFSLSRSRCKRDRDFVAISRVRPLLQERF